MPPLLYWLSLACRAFQLVRLADWFLAKHKARQAQDAQANVDRKSDADVADELRDRWQRD
jgi:hypothetical protein